MKKYYIILICIFVVITTIPSLGLFFDSPAEDVSENRSYSGFPAFTMRSLKKPTRFFRAVDDYILDHHAFRHQLSDMYIYTMTNRLKESPFSEKAVFGKEDWLFLGNSYGENYNLDLRIQDNNSKRLDIAVDKIAKAKYFCDSLNIPFYFVIAPNKGTIYPEYLKQIPTERTRLKDLFKNRLCNEVGITAIDLTNALLSHKSDTLLYHSSDSHWNSLGAFYATHRLLDSLKADFAIEQIHKDDYFIERVETGVMDIARMISLNYVDSGFQLQLKDKSRQVESSTVTVSQNGIDYSLIYAVNNSAENDIKSIVIRDSFFGTMEQFYSQAMRKSIIISPISFDEDLIKKIIKEDYTPDFILFEIVERDIININ